MKPTEEQLSVLEQAETILRSLGIREVKLFDGSAMAMGGRERAVEAYTLAKAAAALCDPETWTRRL